GGQRAGADDGQGIPAGGGGIHGCGGSSAPLPEPQVLPVGAQALSERQFLAEGDTMIPGIELVDHKAETIGLIKSRRNPDQLSPLELLSQARVVGTEVLDSEFFAGNETFYVLYEHPVIEKHNEVYLVKKQELLSFLRTSLKPERSEGLDVTVTPQDDL